jgi:AraC-like DNA-binding protein
VVSVYRELPARASAASIVCVWEQLPEADHVQLVVPDGYLDLIWLSESSLVIAGADTGPRLVELPAGRRTSGVRLRTGAGGSFVGQPASEIRDQIVDATAVFGQPATRLQEQLAQAEPDERLTLLVDAVVGRRTAVDQLVEAAARSLAAPGARVTCVAAELGVSERQLNRRTLDAIGYGPKMLARVARLRRLVAVRERSLALRALAAGFASQAHMSDEIRRLTGLTAVRFLEDRLPAPP